MNTSTRSIPILTALIEAERDVVLARQRAWQLAEQLGFDVQERTRIATAVSEIARNTYNYAGNGRVEFTIEGESEPLLVITFIDKGPGIARIGEILRGRYVSETGMGLGMTGARKLMDEFAVDTAVGEGTTVRIAKRIPSRGAPLSTRRIVEIAGALAAAGTMEPADEVQRQNRELMALLDELGRRQEELLRLNTELEDTNRGVVALYAELDERAERLREADEIKSRFLSHMSHEFRTPLSSIQALARLLLDRTDGELTSEQEKQVLFIRRSAEDLHELVNDLLDLAKVESGRTDVNVERFTIEALFGALRGVMKPLMISDAVALNFDAPAVPLEMLSDESKIAQILRNLISNAIKFTEKGEVRVDARASDDGASVIFTVTDTGIGIGPDDLELIFEEFGQVRNRFQRRVKGTGLGLPLSRRLAELLGGSISVTSDAGKGSQFTVSLPRVLAADSGEPVGTNGVAEGAGQCRVLVIDDELAPRYLLRRLLEEQGCTVIEATCGVEGIRLALEERPDLVLLDLVMPDLTGFQVAERLRQNPGSSDIPIHVVTSKVLTEQERGELAGRSIEVVPKDSVSRDVVQAIVRGVPRRRS
jgi:signal transduction histidine kinase